MTKLLEEAIEAVRKLPAERQDELAEVLVSASTPKTDTYTKEQLEAIDEGTQDADAGRFASDEDVAALFSKYHTT